MVSRCSPRVVQGKLGGQVVIQGFDDLTDGQLKELAGKIAGQKPLPEEAPETPAAEK